MMSYQVGKRTAKQILLEYLGQKVKWNNIQGIKAIEVASHEIEENVGTCCAITMDPDEVEDLIYKLKEILKNIKG
jgi:hypothetical protein